jgi:hypothetical protein
MKHIEIKFPNGEVWRIPAQVVVESRAEYFSELDYKRGHSADKELAFQAELKFALRHDDELLDYLQNNMDWNDVQMHAVRVDTPPVAYDYATEFDLATFKVKGG